MLTERGKVNVIKRFYFDVSSPAGFATPKRLQEFLKSQGYKIDLKTIKNFLKSQDAYTLHYKRRKKFQTRKTIAPRPGFQLQADLMDFSGIKNMNDNKSWLLTTIDVFSRLGDAEPVKTKTSKAVTEAFKKILRRQKPKNLKILQTDSGGEFLGSAFQSYLKNRGIMHMVTNSPQKASICERWNLEIRRKMYRYFTANNTLRFIEILPSILKSYNGSKHSGIGIAPINVTTKNQKKIFKKQYGEYLEKQKKVKNFKFNIGETVRIALNNKIFKKGALPQFTKERFYIYKQIPTFPPTYKLKAVKNDEIIQGIFYNFELTSST